MSTEQLVSLLNFTASIVLWVAVLALIWSALRAHLPWSLLYGFVALACLATALVVASTPALSAGLLSDIAAQFGRSINLVLRLCALLLVGASTWTLLGRRRRQASRLG